MSIHMLAKNISEINYSDILQLKNDRVEESAILDYKRELPQDNDIIKHVCAFANVHGGHIIIGVEASKDGGCPIHADGVGPVNKERIEHILLSNISPRLNVRIKTIPVPNEQKLILVIQVPDSYLAPHCAKDYRFYKRFNFESVPMTEQEIADSYKRRFTSSARIEQYVEDTLIGDLNGITGNIIVIPSNIQHRLIDTYDPDKYRKIEHIVLQEYDDVDGLLKDSLVPFSHGLISGCVTNEDGYTAIHRNGCVHHVGKFHQLGRNFRVGGRIDEDQHKFQVSHFAIRIMQMLEFTSAIMEKYTYFGEVKIITTLSGSTNTRLRISTGRGTSFEDGMLESGLMAHVEREYPSDYIRDSYQQITANIMHEVVNYYGIARFERFDCDDKWIPWKN